MGVWLVVHHVVVVGIAAGKRLAIILVSGCVLIWLLLNYWTLIEALFCQTIFSTLISMLVITPGLTSLLCLSWVGRWEV